MPYGYRTNPPTTHYAKKQRFGGYADYLMPLRGSEQTDQMANNPTAVKRWQR